MPTPAIDTNAASMHSVRGRDHLPSPEEVQEFQTALKADTGVELSFAESSDRLVELTALVRMLLSPIPEDSEGS